MLYKSYKINFMIDALIETLNKNYLKYVCIIENLKRGEKEFFYLSKTSVAFKILPSGIIMIAGSGDIENAVLSVKHLTGTFFTPDVEIKDLIKKHLSLNECSCLQYLYGRQDIESKDIEFKKLGYDSETVEFVTKNYSLGYTKEQVYHVLKDKMLFGGFINGEICGFVGMHEELSVGLLEVLSKFKRQGIGSFLLKTCVNYFIDNGLVPFCHVRSENVASIELHKKLNCIPFDEFVYWF